MSYTASYTAFRTFFLLPAFLYVRFFGNGVGNDPLFLRTNTGAGTIEGIFANNFGRIVVEA